MTSTVLASFLTAVVEKLCIRMLRELHTESLRVQLSLHKIICTVFKKFFLLKYGS